MTDLKQSQLAAVTDLQASDALALGRGAAGKRIAGSNLIAAFLNAYAELKAIENLTSAADKSPYFTGASTAALATVTSAARALLDDADASAMLTTLGVSAFIKTLLDDADAATARATLGLDLGSQLDYVSRDTNVTITATSFATANTFLTSNSLSFDGSTRIAIETYIPCIQCTTDHALYVSLWEDSTDLGIISGSYGQFSNNQWTHYRKVFRTPAAGSHTYSAKLVKDGGTATAFANAGSLGTFFNGYLRISRA